MDRHAAVAGARPGRGQAAGALRRVPLPRHDRPQGLSGDVKYYGSIDLIDARHPQTILAYGLNGKPLPVENGAPLRVRVERQLGYKMPKYVHTIELVDSFANIGGGQRRLLGRQWLRLVWRHLKSEDSTYRSQTSAGCLAALS